MIRPNVDSTRNVLSHFSDPASLPAMEAYFSFYRTLKGDAALDQKGILDAFRRGYQGCAFPFATVAEQFHLIDSPTVTLYLSLQESQPLIAQLQAGLASRALYRKLGQYAVQIYPSHLQALLDAGAAELLDGASYRLTDPSLYDRTTGLSLEADTGSALLI